MCDPAFACGRMVQQKLWQTAEAAGPAIHSQREPLVLPSSNPAKRSKHIQGATGRCACMSPRELEILSCKREP